MNFKEIQQSLVEDAKRNPKKYPVRFDHCFARILLDQLFQDKWTNHLEKPAYKNLNPTQLSEIKRLHDQMIQSPELSFEWNRESLKWRNKLKNKGKQKEW